MNKSLLTLTASAFLVATTMGMAQAQSTGQSTGDDRMQGQRADQGQQRDRMKQGRDGSKEYGKRHHRGSPMLHHRMGRHGMGGGMMGGGMDRGMGHGAMMQVVFAMMDADGNGTLSLQEVQDAHARIFAHMDANDDDQVTKEEIRAFFKGDRGRKGDRDRRRSGQRDSSEMMDDQTTDDMSGDMMDDGADDSPDVNLSDQVGDDDAQ